MAINIIVCMDKQGLIGVGNELPWSIPDDLKYFKKTTIGNTVVMGRKTWDSIPLLRKPLSNRRNIVLSQRGLYAEGVEWYPLIEEVLELPEDVFIIGGAEIYKQFYPHCDKLYITYVNDTYEGNIYFPIKITQINEDFEMESRKITDKCEYIVMRRKYERN